jgi:hypothetical protein
MGYSIDFSRFSTPTGVGSLSYIYKLSREKGYTSKKRWEEKVSNIAKDLMAIDSMQRQYQRTIIPLYDYKS